MISLRKNDIATLMTLGASKKSIAKIFTITNFLVAFIGYLFGLLLSLVVTFLLINSNLIESFSIDLSFYGIKGFPIVFSKSYLLTITGFVFIITFLASYLPAKFYLSKKVAYLIKDYME
jgi:putative ABC transport system permease protein